MNLAVSRVRERPGPTLGAAGAIGVVGAAVLAVSFALPVSAGLVAVAVYAVVAAAVVAGLPQHPHVRFGAANVITLGRAGGAAVFAGLAAAPGLLAGPAGWVAAGAAALLLALDGLDGWLAGRGGLASDFGARFDMETDALLILALSALALGLGKAGPWVLLLGATRYAFVAAGAIWPRLAAPLPPSFRRKAICVVQVAVLTALLAPPLAPPVSSATAALALAALLWSFAIDLHWLMRTRP